MDRFCFLTQICCYIHPGTNVDTTNAVEKNSIIEFLSTMGCIVLAYPRTPFFWANTPQCPIQLRLEGCQTLTPNLCVAVDVCADPISKKDYGGKREMQLTLTTKAFIYQQLYLMWQTGLFQPIEFCLIYDNI